MSEPIRIFHGDTDEEVKARHDRVIKRLVELGPGEVRSMIARDALPSAWHPIIQDWLKGK